MERLLFIADELWHLGPHHQSVLIAGEMARRGHQIAFVQLLHANDVMPCDRLAELASVDLYCRVAWPNRIDTAGIRRLREITRQFRPGLIHAWGPRASRAVNWLAGTGHTPVISCGHEGWPNAHTASNRMSRWDRFSQRTKLTFGDASSQQGGRSTSTASAAVPWGWPWRPTQRPSPSHVASLKRLLNIPADSKWVGTVAPLEPRFRVKDFIWAADLLGCIRDDVYWLVIGDGRQRWRLQKFAAQTNCLSQLRFAGWHEMAEPMIQGLDVYISPSSRQSDCNGLMAAMAAGVPVVATNEVPHRSFIRNGWNGYLIEAGARNEIARCVQRIVDQPRLADQMGLRSQAKLKREFCLQRMVERLGDVYSSVLASAAADSRRDSAPRRNQGAA